MARLERWDIRYSPPPIPDRRFDWSATHDNYDAEYSDGAWSDNGLALYAQTPLDLVVAIVDSETDKGNRETPSKPPHNAVFGQNEGPENRTKEGTQRGPRCEREPPAKERR